MFKKINQFVATTLLVVFFGFSSAATAFEMDWPNVFVDNGVIYGVSNTALISKDLQTGVIRIDYADGNSFESDSGNASVGLKDVSGVFEQRIWISRGQAKPGFGGLEQDVELQGMCASKAAGVVAAMALMDSACEDGPSLDCSGAQAAFDRAVSAYSACVRHFLEVF